MAIPAKAARNAKPFHRLVAGNDVFDRSRQQMAIMGQARGKRRAVIERKKGPPFALFDRALK